MNVDPYLGLSNADAKEPFLSRLREILDDAPADAKMRVSELTATSPQITERMDRVRDAPFRERLRTYKEDRLGNQRRWCTKRARENEKKEKLWFFGGFALQTGAALAALVLVFLRILTLNVVGILATASAAARSWSNARSHRELSQSYALTARDLAILDSRVDQVITEADLAKLVLEVEQAISREHTKWIFRRFP